MANADLARLFYELADLQEILGIPWKPIAFRRAARVIETYPQDVSDIYKKRGLPGLLDIPGVGEGIAKKIVQYLSTGKIEELEKTRRQLPPGLSRLLDIQGLGPKKTARLYKELHITSIEKLETAAKNHTIRKLSGFGEKSEKDIIRGLELYKQGHERLLLGAVLPLAQSIEARLRQHPDVTKADVAGSVRRRKETVKDIDILVVSKAPEKVTDFFSHMSEIQTVLAKGPTKCSVRLRQGLNADLRVVEEKSYGAALAYFTGSKEHNIRLRQQALRRGWTLSEYGLFTRKGKKQIAGRTEEDLYKKFGLPFIPPELRENTGEIEAAAAGQLPKLIPYNSLRGDLHLHTNWSDGSSSTEEMVRAAEAKGYEYIAITDHSLSSRIANGLSPQRLLQHLKEIDTLQKKYPSIRIFKGAEVDILGNGKLDYPDKILKSLDIVVASIHSGFKSDVTGRIVSALQNPYVTILAHPTGRLINERDPYPVDLEKVFDAARSAGVALEVNASPSRLDLSDTNIKKAVQAGVRLVINTDAHSASQLSVVSLGIAQARRGWATQKNIINTLPLKKLEKLIQK